MKKEIKDFKNIHKGKRCFILGCAPSLSDERLDLLDDEIVFACNKAFYAKDTLKLKKFDYYFVGDAIVYKELYNHRYDALANMKATRFYSSKVAEINPTLNIREDYVNIPKTYADKQSVEIKGFPSNIEKGWGTTRATGIDASIIAFYMGFKEIYWLGVDYDYSNLERTHFYGTGPREQLLVLERLEDKKQITFRRTVATIKHLTKHFGIHDVVFKNLSKGFKHKDVMHVDRLENIIRKK
jgi:hypothetical protein